jgi:hypothetical protein
METASLESAFEDDRPFVIEACGDSMWDEVLAQPAYNVSLQPPLPPPSNRRSKKSNLPKMHGTLKTPKKSA